MSETKTVKVGGFLWDVPADKASNENYLKKLDVAISMMGSNPWGESMKLLRDVFDAQWVGFA